MAFLISPNLMKAVEIPK